MTTFVAWTGNGIGARATAAPGAARAAVEVTASWSVREAGTTTQDALTSTLPLVGPGDVVGIDPAQVAQTVPAAGTLTAPPEELAFVELHSSDLPWRYTPTATAPGSTRVPWIGLLVLRAQDVDGVRELGEGRRSVLVPVPLLPVGVDWSLWAHVEGERARLVAPRVLDPGTEYLACVVPTFEAGRRAGLGLAVDGASGTWTAAGTAPLPLPVYASWTFTTSPGGTFEELARRIRPLDAAVRASTGRRLVDTTTLGEPAVSGAAPRRAAVGGALVIGPAPSPVADRRVAALLTGDASSPPVYGRWHAGAAVPSARGASWPTWLTTLNRSPALRAAAAAGARVVARRQDEFMASAWAQAGDVRTANALLRAAQVGTAVSSTIMARRIEPLTPVERWQVLAAHLDRVRRSPTDPTTVAAELAGHSVAPWLSGHWRRALRPRGSLVRRLERRWRNPDRPRSWDPAELLEGLATGRVQVPRFAPSGVTGVVPAMARSGFFDPTELAGLGASLARFQASATAPVDDGAVAGNRIGEIDAMLREELDPRRTIGARVTDRLQLAAGPRGDVAPLLISPRIPLPMYSELLAEGRDWLLPGLDAMPADTVTSAATHQRVIEAFLVGMNHAMGSEMLWRGFPTDQRGTVFDCFWPSRPDPVTGRAPSEITPLHTWSRRSTIGRHRAGGVVGVTVVLVRGELLRRFPAAPVVLVAAAADGRPSTDPSDTQQPLFRAWVEPDLALVGFTLPAREVRGRYLLLSEPALGRRFRPADPPSSTSAAPVVTVAGGGWITGVPGASDSAQVAAALVARQVRLFIHGSRLLTT